MKSKILVIGSTNVDFIVKSESLPAKGETVTGGTFHQAWGGKGANQAVAAARAGGNVTFVTNLGSDSFAGQLTESFRKDGIDTGFVSRDESAATGSALIMVDSKGNNCISVAPGANFSLRPGNIDGAVEAVKAADMIVLQMEIPFETISYIINLAREYDKKVMFNLAPAMPFDRSVLKNTWAFVVNEVEASMVAGLRVETDEDVVTASESIRRMGPSLVVITLGKRGLYADDGIDPFFLEAFRVDAIDTTAAGDVFCGSLAVALSEGFALRDAMRFASAASAVSVTRLGAQPSIPFRYETENFLSRYS